MAQEEEEEEEDQSGQQKTWLQHMQALVHNMHQGFEQASTTT